MVTEAEGKVLRKVKAAYGRRMVCLLTDKYGKISAGTSISEKGRNKSALALRPFAHGRYELFKGRDSYSINGAETMDSFYSIGEDIDKFSRASGALELADRMLEDEQPAAGMFNLLLEYLTLLEKRRTDFDTLYTGFKIKALTLYGSGISADACVKCGKTEDLMYISVPDGGALCGECAPSAASLNPLIFDAGNDIISVIRFMQAHPLRSLEKLSLSEALEKRLARILKAYYSYHLGIDALKSESLII